eukprot:gene11040-11195_t
MALLSEVTAGWDAVETDLRAAAGKSTQELESVLVATQVVVNAVITLLEAGKFEQWQHFASITHCTMPDQAVGAAIAMQYVTELLAAGRVTVKPSPEVADLYVQLLARFEPHHVLPFLQSHNSYNVAAAIKACKAQGVTDAEAFLHERLGDLDAALRLLKGVAGGGLPLGTAAGASTSSSSEARNDLAIPPQLLAVVCVMADHVPLLDIVSRVLQKHGHERFGEFRPTLLGLFGATADDGAILVAANRLLTRDAFAAVSRAYGLRKLARLVQQQEQDVEQQDIGLEGAMRQAAASAAADSSGLAASDVVSSPVRTALALGVLGRGGAGNPGNSVTSVSTTVSQFMSEKLVFADYG